MSRKTALIITAIMLSLLLVNNARASLPPNARLNLANLPLSFQANRGQSSDEVRYETLGAGFKWQFTDQGAVLILPGNDSAPSALRLNILGSAAKPTILGQEQLSGTVNIFRGNDPKAWITGIPTYGKLRYGEVYPGVDLVFYGNQGKLEYDFIVAPGADPKVIKLELDGAEQVRLNDNGDLLIKAAGREFTFKAPLTYQERRGEKIRVLSAFQLSAANQVTFQVGAYDKGAPLIIDPVVIFSTVLSGDATDLSTAVTLDEQGYIYFTGATFSVSFPVTPGSQPTYGNGSADIFVAKLQPDGRRLVYLTCIAGDKADAAFDIAVDKTGAAHVCGYSESADYPVTPGAFRTHQVDKQWVVSKLSPDGKSLVYSCKFGGDSLDEAKAIALDSQGAAYIAGLTESFNFPSTFGAYHTTHYGNRDAYLVKLNPQGSERVYATYLGGGADDSAYGLVVDEQGCALVLGTSKSANFPTTPGCFQPIKKAGADCILTKFNPAGTGLVFSTFLGGGADDIGFDLVLDSNGNPWLTGGTSSTDFPLKNQAYNRPAGSSGWGFLTRMDKTGTTIMNSTFYGGTSSDPSLPTPPPGITWSMKIAMACGSFPCIAGFTDTADLPTVNPTQAATGGARDLFCAMFSEDAGRLLFATYLGGSQEELLYMGLAADDTGNLVISGYSDSNDFPLKNGLTNTHDGTAPRIALAKIFAGNRLYGVVKQDNRGLADVKMTLDNGGGECSTEANGVYSRHLPNAWAGTITPSKPCYYFSPRRVAINNLITNRAQNFTAYNRARMTGVVKTGNKRVKGAVISFSGGGGLAKANSSGVYRHGLPCAWAGLVKAVPPGYRCTPVKRFTKLSTPRKLNFRCVKANNLAIRGRITKAGKPVNGVKLTFTMKGGVTRSNSTGRYEKPLPYNWAGVITPRARCLRFQPVSKAIDAIDKRRTVNFQAFSGVTVSGRVTYQGQALASVRLAFTGAGSAYTNGKGEFVKKLKCGWSGRILPQKTGYTFKPAYKTMGITRYGAVVGFSARK